VVTGASSGIGRSIALELATAGADVVVHCRRSREAGELLVSEIQQLGRRSELVTADLSDESACEGFVSESWEVFQGVDIWVNNAGADLLTGSGPTLDYSEKLQLLLNVDVRATMLLSKLAGVRMKQCGAGCLLNIGWDQADRGMGGDSGELFAAAKNAVMGFSRSLALSLAPKVRVNCIAPGWVRTAWGEQAPQKWQERVLSETPLNRWGTPEDIAKLARFLVSDEAGYLTGQVINANGGAVR